MSQVNVGERASAVPGGRAGAQLREGSSMGVAAASSAPLTVDTGLRYVGAVVGLMADSDLHRRWRVADIVRLIYPPLELQQAWVFFRGKNPVGYFSWAYLSAEAEEGFQTATRRLKATDWKSGNRLWYIDVIAPYGDLPEIVAYGRQHAFSKGSGRFTRRRRDGSIRRVHTPRQYPNGKQRG